MKRRAFIGMSGTTIASVSGCTLEESNNTGYWVHVGFGSEVVNDTFNPRYVATREMFPFGSYEVNNGVQHISGEQKLREAARDLVLSL